MEDLMAVVLAAGEGKRMKSKSSKVVHEICGKPLIKWVYDAVTGSGISDCVLVVGHRADQVKECMGDRVKYALQREQLGTGHAVMQASQYFMGKELNFKISKRLRASSKLKATSPMSASVLKNLFFIISAPPLR